jgi:3-hydroxyisobutyrate dehydrogenase-like beta-hydroxyacid dehydrogenase
MRVGFIGLGTQGKPLAANIARAKFDLTVFDVREEPMVELAALGAKTARTPQGIGACEIILVCVLNDAQIESALLGPHGALGAAKPGAIVAIHSTVDPATIAKVADMASAKQVEVLDAPVSGGEAGAMAKTMSYMVGGSEQALNKCRPVFEASGTKITYTGALGTGIRAKLAHQLIICVNMMAAYEGMSLGLKAGLTPELLQKIVTEGAAQSRIADRWFQLKLGSHAQEVFYKDLQLCLKYARDLGLGKIVP